MLLDECVTRKLKADFAGHDVYTIEQAGLKGLKNGQLLQAASDHYDVLVTVDKNMPHQQNLKSFNIAVLVLAAKKNNYESLRPLIPQALNALQHIRPGMFVIIDK